MTDLITFSGVACALGGVYLLLGTGAALLTLGLFLIYVGVRRAQLEELPTDEHN